MDEGANHDWGEAPRRIEDTGRFLPAGAASSFTQTDTEPEIAGTGFFSVKIGDREFTCLRAIDITGNPSEEGLLMEAFISRGGRTILCRRYNGRLWNRGTYKVPWDDKLPANHRIIIDGISYVHWYDCLTDTAIGKDA